MKRKRIKINWDDLEDAFTTQPDELGSFLDTVTGHIVLEGEGEGGDLEDDEGLFEAAAAAGPVPSGEDGTRLAIHPPDEDRKIEWMKGFVAQTASRGGGGLSPEVIQELSEALSSEDPADAVGEVLRHNPDEREAWFLFRSERLHEYIDEWLAANGVEADPPPWH